MTTAYPGRPGQESLPAIISFPKLRERRSLSAFHPSILSPGRSNKFSQPLETSYCESCISPSCTEPNVIFVEAGCDSRSVTCQSAQNGGNLRGLQSRKNELSVQTPFACKLPPSRFLSRVSWLFAFTRQRQMGMLRHTFFITIPNSQGTGGYGLCSNTLSISPPPHLHKGGGTQYPKYPLHSCLLEFVCSDTSIQLASAEGPTLRLAVAQFGFLQLLQ